MSQFGHPVKRSEIPDLHPGYCGCESAYCAQHGGHLANEDYAYPGCDPCPNVPEGHFTMDWLGVVCDECAKVNPQICHEIVS